MAVVFASPTAASLLQVKTVVELGLSPSLPHKYASTILPAGRYFRLDPDSGEGDVDLIEDNTVHVLIDVLSFA